MMSAANSLGKLLAQVSEGINRSEGVTVRYFVAQNDLLALLGAFCHLLDKQLHLVIDPRFPVVLQRPDGPVGTTEGLPQGPVRVSIERGEQMRGAQDSSSIKARLAIQRRLPVDLLESRRLRE